jgi:hypothetical protein
MSAISPKLKRLHKHFVRALGEQIKFVYSLNTLYFVRGKKNLLIKKTQREKLCEMTFVVLFTAWEKFLESSFDELVVDAPLWKAQGSGLQIPEINSGFRGRSIRHLGTE